MRHARREKRAIREFSRVSLYAARVRPRFLRPAENFGAAPVRGSIAHVICRETVNLVSELRYCVPLRISRYGYVFALTSIMEEACKYRVKYVSVLRQC